VYKDPYAKFGQLSYEMWRAVRLVVDTGMHSMGWDARASDSVFQGQYRKKPIRTSRSKSIATSCGPARRWLISWGQLKIRELRTEAEKRLGAKFDVRKFHDAVLEEGRGAAECAGSAYEAVDGRGRRLISSLPGPAFGPEKSPPESKERATPQTGPAALQAKNRYLSSLEKRRESGTP